MHPQYLMPAGAYGQRTKQTRTPPNALSSCSGRRRHTCLSALATFGQAPYQKGTSMKTELISPIQVAALKQMLGISALVVDLHLVDYSRGRGVLEGLNRCLWTYAGQRITITVIHDGGMIVSQTKDPDPDLPPAEYPEVNIHLRKCIMPECETLVDLRERKSGACCREHMNYECSHQDCVLRAQANGWPRATHPYGTKIAKLHLPWRVSASTKELP